MIRKAIALIGAISLISCVSSCSMTEKSMTETTHHTDVPPKMLFLGDSIAAGYGLEGYTSTDNYNCRSYSNILKEKYEAELGGECGHTMVNKAVSGATSEDLIGLLQSGDIDDDLKDCDAVVVSIGGNDLLGILLGLLEDLGVNENGNIELGNVNIVTAASALFSMDGEVEAALEQFDVNIKTISEELLKRTDGTVYIQTLYDPLEYYSKHKTVTDFSNEKIGKLNSIISENASCGYTVIDVAADFKGKAEALTNISSFDIHPNAAGHEVIAADVDAAFRATGFTYVTTSDEGRKKLSGDGKKALVGGIAGLVVLFGAGTVFILKKKKKRPEEEKD